MVLSERAIAAIIRAVGWAVARVVAAAVTAPVVAVLALASAACVGAHTRGTTAREPARLSAARLAEGASLTVITFFSARCPCQQMHDARLNDLFLRYQPRGVRFVAIDSEADASAERDAAESAARRYAYPLLSDPAGALADELGAAYATFTVVIDAAGRVRYRGGIDSDRSHLTSEAHEYLREALDALLSGREPAASQTKALGCSLRRR